MEHDCVASREAGAHSFWDRRRALVSFVELLNTAVAGEGAVDDDVGAMRRERLRDAEPDARGRAGDESDTIRHAPSGPPRSRPGARPS